MKRLFFPALAALALSAAPARAADVDIPVYMSHQGRLLDAQDAPVSGPHDLTFTLYTHVEPSKDGSYTDDTVWSETQKGVQILNGIYAVRLGAVTPLDATKLNGKLFLGVKIDGTELLPRAWMSTVPFAWSAQNANRAQKAVEADHAATATEADHAAKAAEADHATNADLASDADALGGILPAGYLQLGATPATQQGSAAIDGTFSAQAFIGDGSLVTGVNATKLGGLAPNGFAQISATPATQTGSLALSGTVTAGKFVGDGSSLTAVNAATLGGRQPSDFQAAGSYLTLGTGASAQAGAANITGSMTAARFIGDGSNLTAVNAATLGGKSLSSLLQAGQPVTLPAGTATNPPYACGSATAGTTFFDTGTKSFLSCDGTSFQPLSKLDSTPDGSTPLRAAASCKAIHAAYPAGGSSIYWLTTDGTAANTVPVYCDMVTDGGGWTMVFKLTAGAGGDVVSLWNTAAGGTPVNDLMAGYIGVSRSQDQYASRLVGQWNKAFPVNEARVHLYTGGNLQKFVKFSATGSGAASNATTPWFTPAKLTGSSWTDLATNGTYNFFSIDGDVSSGRRFFINKLYAGCPGDVGWLMLSNSSGPCTWDNMSGATPRFAYAPGTTSTTWQTSSATTAFADVFAVFVR